MIQSILITLGISTCFAFLFQEQFIPVFIVATILQFLIWSGIRTLYINRLKKQAAEIQADIESSKIKSLKPLSCPCGQNHVQNVEVSLNEDVEYECERCERKVQSMLSINTALKTTPIYTKK
jgi:hypothetical protein